MERWRGDFDCISGGYKACRFGVDTRGEAKIIGWEGYLFVVEHKHEAKPLGVVKGEDLRVKMDCKSL